MTSLNQSMRPHPQVVDTELDGQETVLLHLESKLYFSLNPTGTRIWQGLKRGLSPATISRELQMEFTVEPEAAEQSVMELIGELTQQRLLERAD